MKRLLSILLVITPLFVGCENLFRDEIAQLHKEIDAVNARLDEFCNKTNENIAALQTMILALQAKDYVVSVLPVIENGVEVGYQITFEKSGKVTIYHGKDGANGADGADGADGKDGKDGYAPQIGVKLHTDGLYYWTIDSEWLTDEEGNKIKAVGVDGINGSDGKDGEDGKDGQDGAAGPQGPQGPQGEPGKDAITPQLKIEDGNWFVSADGGKTWDFLGKATGEDGQDGAAGPQGPQGEQGEKGEKGDQGDSVFSDVEITEEYVIITLADGQTQIVLPTWGAFNALKTQVDNLNADMAALQGLVAAWEANDYVKNITPLPDGSGYILTFVHSGTVTIYHGKDGADGSNGTDGAPGTPGADGSDGKDGLTPVISVKKDTDGVWYWTIDGEWLLNGDGNKVKAVGTDGQDGTNGSNGSDGSDGVDGKDGITPKFKIENGMWYVSYNEGETWELAGQATGNQGGSGEAGDSMFAAVDSSNPDYIIIALTDGRTLKFPTWSAFETLKAMCNEMNTNISSLQSIVTALQNNDYVTGVTEITDNGKVIGYTIHFSKSAPAVIYHGKDGVDGTPGQDGENGKDGYVPNIGLKQDTDGVWYWTLDGEWLLDSNGNKVKASAKDGADGSNGAPGQDGSDGKDGVSPKLKIENGSWYISYDNGITWTYLAQATGDKGDIGEAGPEGPQGPTGPQGPAGEAGQDGDSMFSDIEITAEYVIITLADGTTNIQIPTWKSFSELAAKVESLNADVAAIKTLVEAWNHNDYVKSITALADGSGYVIEFVKSGKVTIYHGKDGSNGTDGAPGQDGSNGTDGKDGHSPVVSVRQDTDGVWYWTIDGEWLIDGNGNKVVAVGKDGAPGQNGSNGSDGITPKFKIEEGFWYISYDNGTTWEIAGQATGNTGGAGEAGDSLFAAIDSANEDFIVVVLTDGRTLKFPTWKAYEDLKELCNQMNTNISSLQNLINSNDYVTGVSEIWDNGEVIGYTISFTKSNPIVIYHGKNGSDGKDGQDGAPGQDGEDGKDGYVPNIGLRQDTDGEWYWTLDGEWLLDGDGHRIKASAKDGANGTNGQNGVAPRLKITDGYWYVSYDNGTTWEVAGQATGDKGDVGATGPEGPQGPTGPEGPQGPAGPDGEDGKDGDTLISDIEITDDYVLITLADGQQIQIPTWAAYQALEQKVNQMNTNIEAIQTVLTALQNNDYVTGVTKIYEGGKEVGYTISFSKSGSISIFHGMDGQNGSNGTNGTDGHTPAIAVRQDTDGIWYWTIDDEWLLDGNGNKVKAAGTDGQNGANGSNGSNGTNGVDGITPKFKIENGMWYVSYDNGQTWEDEPLGQATGDKGDVGETGPEGPQGPIGPEGPQGPAGSDGEDGKDGDTLISNIEITDDYVLIILADGQQIQLPTWAAYQALEQKVNQMNTNIEAIQTVLTALQNNDYVTGVTKIYEGGKEIGYTISFSKSGSISIFHGMDGQNGSNGTNGTDGHTPAIAVRQDTDGIWYWTIDDEWLLDGNGNKVKAAGTDGQNGVNGSNGSNGTNGVDGITPKFKIENGMWYVSYDNGQTWEDEPLGQATGDKGDVGATGPEGPQGPTGPEGPQGPAGPDGEDGKDGDTLISDIEITDDYVLITLADGQQIQIPTWAAYQALEQKVNQMNTNIEAIQTILTALQNNDYVTGVTKIYEGGKEIGYTITFSKSGSVTIYHGKDGQNGSNGTNGTDGHTPAIAVKQDTDGVWYWTIDDEWLLDGNGNKVKAAGTDGQNGVNGSNGSNGTNGVDGITPKFKIENGMWYVSYDNGQTWETEPLGQATGEQGDSLFKDIDSSNKDYVIVTLYDGQTITLPTSNMQDVVSKLRSVTYIPKNSDGKATMTKNVGVENGIAEFDFQISPKDAVKDIAANWQSILSMRAVYTQTRAVSFVELPILSCETDTTNGVITITASGENLSEEFFAGRQEASAALYISDGNSSIVSAFIQIFTKIDIPDLALKKYLVDNYDDDGNHEISIAEADNITMVNCSGKGVADLTGLESCTNLVTLNCSNNNITKIELPNLTQLETVTCNDCPIEIMNFNGCTSLQYLNLQNATTNAIIEKKLKINNYTQAASLSIDVSNTTLEQIFVCRSEILTHLDVSKNTHLKTLEAYVNPNLRSIDVSTLINLEFLDLGDCDLTNLDVSKNLMLIELYVTNNKLSTIDVSQNKQLKILKCKGNQISNLNLLNNDKLETLVVENNKLSAINVRNNTALTHLNINNNVDISMVDVKYNTALTNLYCNGLAIGELNIANNTALTKLECHSNPNLTSLICNDAFDFTTTHISINKGLNIISANGSVLTPSVGDLITVNLGTGVVVSASSSCMIVSVLETSTRWYDAKTWCSDYGSDWYLPSLNVLKTIYRNKSTINSTLSANGFATLGTSYWSSTDDIGDEAVDSRYYAYKLNFSDGYSSSSSKNGSGKVRAVLTF